MIHATAGRLAINICKAMGYRHLVRATMCAINLLQDVVHQGYGMMINKEGWSMTLWQRLCHDATWKTTIEDTQHNSNTWRLGGEFPPRSLAARCRITPVQVGMLELQFDALFAVSVLVDLIFFVDMLL